MPPLISVVVPNYNHSEYLERRIESILSQTFQEFEIILLDDCSSDNSIDILNSYASHEKVTHLVVNNENSGSPFIQWNRGVSLAEGEYIWIAESDDCAQLTFLEETVGALQRESRVGLVYTASESVGDFEGVAQIMRKYYDRLDSELWKSDFIMDGNDFCRRYLISKNVIPNASAVLFRKSLYKNIGGADTDFKLAGDWWVWANMLMCSDVIYISKQLNEFRFHQHSVRETRKKDVGVRESFRVAYEIQRKLSMPFDEFYENFFKFNRHKMGPNPCCDELGMIKKSYSYRLGRMILSPLAMLMAVLGSKK